MLVRVKTKLAIKQVGYNAVGWVQDCSYLLGIAFCSSCKNYNLVMLAHSDKKLSGVWSHVKFSEFSIDLAYFEVTFLQMFGLHRLGCKN